MHTKRWKLTNSFDSVAVSQYITLNQIGQRVRLFKSLGPNFETESQLSVTLNLPSKVTEVH